MFINIWREGGREGGGKETLIREKHINQLPPVCAPTGTEPRLCVRTGNQTHNLLVYRTMLQQTQQSSQGPSGKSLLLVLQSSAQIKHPLKSSLELIIPSCSHVPLHMYLLQHSVNYMIVIYNVSLNKLSLYHWHLIQCLKNNRHSINVH